MLNVKQLKISDIKEWKNNPRKNEESVPKLAELLKKHGQRKPIVVWTKNKTVYAGNTTLKAAKLLKWKDISCVLADFPSENAAIAFAISDNRSSEWSEWDPALLNNFLAVPEIKKMNTGFNEVLFDVTLSAEVGAGIEDIIKAKSIFGEFTLSILNRGLFSGGALHVTNLDCTLSVVCAGKDGLIDLSVLSYLKDVTLSHVPGEVGDFPKINHLETGAAVDKTLFDNFGEMIEFAANDFSRAILTNICLSNGYVFATNGYVACWKEKKCPVKIIVPPAAARIISFLYDRITKIIADKSTVTVSGEGFQFTFKNVDDTPPAFNKIIPKGEYKPTATGLRAMIERLAPLITSDTKLIKIDKDGVYFNDVDSGRAFAVKGETGFAECVGYNCHYLLKCMLDEMCVTGVITGTKFRSGDLNKMIMPLRIIDEKKADYKILSVEPSEEEKKSVSFKYEVKQGTVRGEVKGYSKRACENFIKENFNI